MVERKPIKLIESTIGAGHRTFGMALLEECEKISLPIEVQNIENTSALSGLIISMARATYLAASNGGILQNLYESARRGSVEDNKLLSIVRKDIAKLVEGSEIVVSDHAYFAPYFEGKSFIIQSDAGVSPAAYAKPGNYVFVPTNEARDQLMQSGKPDNEILQVGFFMHDRLKDPLDKERREAHLKAGFADLGIFITGASPEPHYREIRKVLGKFSPLIASGRVRISTYAFTNASKANSLLEFARDLGLRVTNGDDSYDGNWQVRVVYGRSAEEAIQMSLEMAKQTDHMITMPGERLPWFTVMSGHVLPPIGPNTYYNTKYLKDNGIVDTQIPLSYINGFLELELKTGARTLLERVNRAREIIPTNGARNSAEILKNEYEI